MSDWVNFLFSTSLPYVYILVFIRKQIDNKRERKINEQFGLELCEQLTLPRVVGWIGSFCITSDINEDGDSLTNYQGHNLPLPDEFLEVEIDAWNINRDQAICLLRFELGEL